MKVRKTRYPAIPREPVLQPLKPQFRDFHRLTMEGAYEYPEHVHEQYEVIALRRGPYGCRLNGTELSVQEGEVLIIQPGDRHQDHLSEGQDHYVLHFSLVEEGTGRESAVPLLSPGIPAAGRILPAGEWDSLGFFAMLEREAEGKDFCSGSIQNSAMELFFWQLVRAAGEEKLSSGFLRVSRQVFFRRELYAVFGGAGGRTLTLDGMAEQLGVSRRTLTGRCRRYLDMSPWEAWSRYRIDRAVSLLLETDLSVKEISGRLGFESPYHFSRVFRKYRAVPPSRFRETR